MKKTYLFILLLLTNVLFGQSDEELYNKFTSAGGIVSFYNTSGNSTMEKEVNMFIFWGDKQKIVKTVGDKFLEYPAKLDRTYVEQGLYIKEYIPTNLLNTSTKRIFKFCYDQESKEAIVVVEIAFTSKTNYTTTKYFTSAWAQKTNYK